jgi:hypothetical protein
MNEPTTMLATPTSEAPTSSNASNTSATAEKLYGEQKASAPQTAPADTAKAQDAPVTGQAEKAAEASADAKPTTPEKYEFKAPEGQEFDGDTITAYSEVARELKLSQDAAQKLLDVMGPKMAERQMAQIQAVQGAWMEASKQDKEFGGPALAENLSVAKKALDAFGTAELRTLLNESGLGNHPEIVRLFFRAGKAISEDRVVTGSTGQAKAGPKSFSDLADVLYS